MKLPARPRAVITGAASGLGRALALRLARRGGRIVIADVNIEAADETASLVRDAGGEAVALRCDVTLLDEVEAAARTAEERFGGVDLAVNNAGVAGGGAVGDMPIEDWRWIVSINLWGVIHGCHVFVPRLRRAGRGAILNVASAAGVASLPEMGAYNVSKAGVIALSETLAGELATADVSVTVLCPSFFPTNILQGFRAPSERHRRLAEWLFSRAKVTADDIAAAALDGVERGALHVFPQREARAIALAKRLSPRAYLGLLGLERRFGLLERWSDRLTRG